MAKTEKQNVVFCHKYFIYNSDYSHVENGETLSDEYAGFTFNEGSIIQQAWFSFFFLVHKCFFAQ